MFSLCPQKIHKNRRDIFFITFILSFFGLIMIYSSSAIHAWKFYSDQLYFFKRQLLSVIIGFALLCFALYVNLEVLRKYSKLLILAGFLVLVMVLFPVWGVKVGGARRWFRILNYNIQASEVFKVLYLIYIADYLDRKKNLIKNFTRGVVPLLLLTIAGSFLIVIEPDLGNSVFLGLIMCILLFVAGVDLKKFIYIFLFLVAVAGIFILISPYRRQRVLTFINPWADPRGKGFQSVEAQISFGVGGILGKGLGAGQQKLFFLPAAYTDFIYAIIGEELGLIGVFSVLILYVMFFMKSLTLINTVPYGFKFNLALGALLIIILQSFINISVSLGLFPTKGLPLPFISYGGSAMMANFFLVGLILNATKS